MTRGETQPGSGSETTIGRRLRVGAVGTIAIGGAIFMGGAATLVTAFANTGGVSAAQDCTTWTVNAKLDNNVSNRLVTVSFPDAATIVKSEVLTTTTSGAIAHFFTATGNAPKTGTITETIYNSSTAAKGIEVAYQQALPAPTNCTAAISTKQSAGGVVGTALSDTATVTGTAGSPAGSVVFELFPPSNASCSTAAGADKPVYTSSAISLTSTTPGVSTAASGSFPSAAPGTYRWVATYTPSSTLYKGAVSGCTAEPVTISQGGPSIATTAGAGGVVPIDVTDSATLSGGVNPTGTVTFTLYPSVADCNAGTNAVGSPSTVALSAGKATSGAVHVTTAGTFQWLAKYSGDANNASATSACGSEPVTTTTGGGGGVQGITTPSTGGTDSLLGITIGGFLLLGGLGVALVGSIVPRRRRLQ